MNLEDRIKLCDNKCLSVNIPHTSGKIIGEVTVTEYDKFGRKVNETIDYNDLTISGANFILEEMFKPTTAGNNRYLHPTTGFPIGSFESRTDATYSGMGLPSIGTNKILGFMVGVGGDQGSSISNVDFNSTTLSFGSSDSVESSASFIPIQILSSDDSFSSTDQDKYKALITSSDGNKYYYVKKFDVEPTISTMFSDGSGDASASEINKYGVPVVVFAKCALSISKSDCREYLKTAAGGYENCYISQIGLVAGKENGNNINDLRLVTYLNFKSRDLTNNENTLSIIYRVYCM